MILYDLPMFVLSYGLNKLHERVRKGVDSSSLHNSVRACQLSITLTQSPATFYQANTMPKLRSPKKTPEEIVLEVWKSGK